MRGKRAKELRRIAQKATVGQPYGVTRRAYQQAKKRYRELMGR